MTWQRTTLPGSLGGKSRSFCLRFLLGLVLPIHCWSTVAPPSVFGHGSHSSHHSDNDQHWLSHARAPSLCADSFDGHEGTHIKGFILDRAFVLTTPGLAFHQDVDSLFRRGGYSSTHCHFHKFAKTHASKKIKNYPEVLWMKGKMFEKSKLGSDFKVLKPVPLYIQCKEDMLTPEGITQAVSLGEYLAKSYMNALSSLSPLSFKTKGVAYSVGDELLYQNVQAVLYGLLAEKQFVHAGVEKLSHHYTDDKKSQPESQEHLSHFVNDAFKKEHHIFKDFSSPTGDRWSIDSEFGREMSAKHILSSISLKECGRPIKESVHLSHDLIENILSVSDVHNRYLLNASIFHNYSKSMTLPFRKFLNSWISSPQRDNDFKIVSVDDLFMLSLLSVFGYDGVQHIPPVSRLVIERFHFQSSPHPKASTTPRSDISSSSSPSSISIPTQIRRHPSVEEGMTRQPENSNKEDPRSIYFRVLYNGKVVTADILNCQSDPLIGLGLCQMPRFALGLMKGEVHFKEEL